MTAELHAVERRIVPFYEDRLTGLDYPIVLVDTVALEADPDTGAWTSHVFPDPDGLDAAVAVIRLGMPVRLSGTEARFVRSVLDLPVDGLADGLGCPPTLIRAWESDERSPDPGVERRFRLFAATELGPRAPAIDLDPRGLLRMDLADRSAGDPTPRIAVRRVMLKDGVTRQVSPEWDRVPDPG